MNVHTTAKSGLGVFSGMAQGRHFQIYLVFSKEWTRCLIGFEINPNMHIKPVDAFGFESGQSERCLGGVGRSMSPRAGCVARRNCGKDVQNAGKRETKAIRFVQ